MNEVSFWDRYCKLKGIKQLEEKTVAQMLGMTILEYRKKKAEYLRSERDEMLKLKNEGLQMYEIAKKLNRPESYVRYTIHMATKKSEGK